MELHRSMSMLRCHGRIAHSASRHPTIISRPTTLLYRPPRQAQTTVAIASGPSVAVPGDVLTNGSGATVPAAPFTIKFPDPVLGVSPPPATYQNNVKAGATKAALPAWRTFLLGIVAGCYIGYGGFLAVSVGANLPGLASTNVGLAKLVTGLVFPFGLAMVTISGAELFTGNTALLTVAMLEKKATFSDLVRNWFWSYAGNLVGSLLMVAAIASSGVLATNPLPATMAVMKTSLPFGQAFIRAVLCNWLVCIAVWQANSATTLTGKLLGLWPPITAFVTIGLEHSVANMWFVPMGIALGAKVSFTHFLTSNLLPVTLGNMVGGIFCMALTYSLAYGALGDKIDGK